MMQKLILIIMMLVLVPVVSAELAPTKISISVPDSADVGDYVRVEGQLTYLDGTQITIGHMAMVMVAVHINGVDPHAKIQCDADGRFWGLYKMESTGNNHIQVVFEDKPHMNLAGSKSTINIITVVNPADNNYDASGLVKFIGYAKGFFALVFFGVLSLTIGTGCYSAAVHDPQKKAGAQDGLFSLLKVLVTVTCFYMAVLYMGAT